MNTAPLPATQPDHDLTWLRRFWLASALALACAAGLALVVGMATNAGAFLAGALALAGFGISLTMARRRIRTGQEVRYLIWVSVAQYVMMLSLLPLIPELAATIVPAALIPVFVATPYLGRAELARYSVAVWSFCVAYALMAILLVAARGVAPQVLGVLAAQLLGVVIVVAFMLVLLRRYATADSNAHFLALHDSLTGLPNRALFMDRLEHAMERGRRRGTTTAVIYVDVDSLKVINDSHGHGYGDEVIRGVAKRILETTRASDTTARVGGDEFTVVLEDIEDANEANALAERLRLALAQPLEMSDGVISVRVSMGIAFSGDGGETPDALLRSADDAMYQSKRQRRGELIVYHPAMRVASDERRAIKQAFRGVVERGELRLQFQPFVKIRAGEGGRVGPESPLGAIVGVEALVRWQDPDRGWRTPAQFVSLAEETGDIVPIGRWVLQEAVRQVADWRRTTGEKDLRVAVNLSGRQLQEDLLDDDVGAVLSASGLPAASLILEITEHVLVSDTTAIEMSLRRLRSQGVQLAIDDFGTGFTSLSSLRDFPIDLLKIDRSLFVDAAGSSASVAVLRAAVEMGVALDAKVVAEGIETLQQLRLLRSLGCVIGQGYLLAPPLDPLHMRSLLQADTRPWDRLLRRDGPAGDRNGQSATENAASPVRVGAPSDPGHSRGAANWPTLGPVDILG